jgi:hypothetical protein
MAIAARPARDLGLATLQFRSLRIGFSPEKDNIWRAHEPRMGRFLEKPRVITVQRERENFPPLAKDGMSSERGGLPRRSS